MEVQPAHPAPPSVARPGALRAAEIFLNLAVVGLWILVPGIVILAGLLFLTSIIFNDSGSVPQKVAPLLGYLLLFDVGLVVLLRYSMRARRDLSGNLPRARTLVLVLGAIYVLIALCIVAYPFPDPLALLPGTLGAWALIYFTRPTARLAFQHPSFFEPTLPVEPPPPV